jgi:hypothetical protein
MQVRRRGRDGGKHTPEEHPLQRLVALELVLEAELIARVVFFQEVEELGGGLDDGEGGVLGVVDESGNPAVGVEAEEPWSMSVVVQSVRCSALLVGDIKFLDEARGREGVCLGVRTLFLLDIRGDVDQLGVPLGAILDSQLFEEDLGGLAVGSVLGDQGKSLSILDIVWRRRDVEVVTGSHGAVLRSEVGSFGQGGQSAVRQSSSCFGTIEETAEG